MAILLIELIAFFALFIMWGIPFFRVIVTGNYTRGIFRIWFYFVAWYFLRLLFNPVVYTKYSYELIDGPELFVAALLGWMPGILFTGLAMFIRELILKFKPSWLKTKEINR